MNVFVPPSTVNQNGRSSEDELEGMLRAYYKAELPNPWPSLEAPAARNDILPMRPPVRRFPMLRSRLALAACVAFLVAGPLALSSYFSGAKTDTVAKPTSTEPSDTATATHDLPWNPFLKDNNASIKVDVPYGPRK
jgi:hypothetical protein